MKVLFLRPRTLWAATALSSVIILALLTVVDGNGYLFPSLFYVPMLFAAMAGGKRAALIAAPVVTAVYLASLALTSSGQSARELATIGTIRLAVALSIGILIGASVDHNRQLVQSAIGRANRDFLTGLGTRHALDEEWADRRAPRTFGVVMIDMDGLKEINDQAGHAAGDAALQALASSIRSGSRSDDVLARLGGDEFVVVADVTDRAELEGIGTRIAQHAREHGVEASIGVAIAPDDGAELADIIHAADHRMYMTKLDKRDGSREPRLVATPALALDTRA